MSQLLPYLFILVCPLTMGVMMWVMMKDMDHGKTPDPRVAELQSQVNELRSAARGQGSTQEESLHAADSLTPNRN